MAGNITLPKVGSQTRVVSPTQPTVTRGSKLLDVVSAISTGTDSILRAKEFQANADAREAALLRQQQLDAQKVENNNVIAGAISDVNSLLAQRDEAAQASTTLQSMSVDVERAFADGNISDEDRKLQQSFLQTFDKVKNARNQGLMDDNSFSIRAREAKQKMITQYPQLASDIDKIYNAATGRSGSSSTGAAAKQQLEFNRRMESKYGIGYTAEDVLVESNKQRFSAENQLNKDLGAANFGQIVSNSNATLNLAIDSISLKATNLYSQKQALSQDELDSLNSQIEQSKRAVSRGLDQQIAEVRSRGGIVDPSTVRAQKDFAIAQLEDLQTFVNDKDLQKMLEKRKAVQNDMWQNGLGGQISKLNSIAGSLGSGGMTALQGFVGTSNPAQDQAVRSLVSDNNLDPSALTDVKSLMVDAAARVANPVPVPGFEKLDAFYGLGAIKAGPTSTPVQTNTLRNLDKLVENPDDVIGAITKLNDPKISLNYSKGSKEVRNELLQKTNGWEDKVFAEIQEKDMTISFDNATQSLLVHRQDDVSVGGGDLMLFGSDTLGKRKTVNRGLTKTVNELFSLHKNPNYVGILQPSNKWLSDITNRFQSSTTPDE